MLYDTLLQSVSTLSRSSPLTKDSGYWSHS